MVTAISKTRPGQVGLLSCQADDSACMHGALTHDLTAFSWIAAPAQVGPGLKFYAGRDPVFIFSTHHHGQVKFDLHTRSFTVCPHGICHW